MGAEAAAGLAPGEAWGELGLLPTVGVGHGLRLGWAQGLAGGEWRLSAWAAGRATAWEGGQLALGWKGPLWGLAWGLAEASAGRDAFKASERQLQGLVGLVWGGSFGGLAWSASPRLLWREEGPALARWGPWSAFAAGVQLAGAWPASGSWQGLAEANGGWGLTQGLLPLGGLRLGLRWAPSSEWRTELALGADLLGLGSAPGRPEGQGALQLRVSRRFLGPSPGGALQPAAPGPSGGAP